MAINFPQDHLLMENSEDPILRLPEKSSKEKFLLDYRRHWENKSGI